MCGIAGYIGRRPLEKERILVTLEQMKNRGPDHQDFREFSADNTYVALLHSRLSIIDLDARSNQPFTIGDCTVVFNGEIYNYIELRGELEKCGVSFRTASDTEVLLQYYIRYGEECVDYFEGMWSFAIYDRSKGHLFLSRDRFAEKPLFYMRTPDGFYFGSEIKCLKFLSGRQLTVNHRQMLRYLVNGYRSIYKTFETFFEEVKEVPYATNLIVTPEHSTREYRYWIPRYAPDEKMTKDDAIEGAIYHINESLRIRLRSDVPLAFCLSGGIDSSALTTLAAKEFSYDVATFSIIDSDERYNEYENIMATVKDIDCRHTLIDIPREETLPRLTDLIEYHDVPITTISYYIHSLLSEGISTNGYKVALSGTAADELFTGYYDHFLQHFWEMRNHPDLERYISDWRKHVLPCVRNHDLRNPRLYLDDPGQRMELYDGSLEFRSYLLIPFDEDFAEETFSTSLLRNRMLNELFHEVIPVVLHEDDHNSMCYSVENRSPYLDKRLFQFCFSIPNRHLISDGYAKHILREAVRGVLNDRVRLDRQKKGFNASINSLIDFQDAETRAYLLDSHARIFEFISRAKVAKLFDLCPIPNQYSKFLFSFINSRIFLETNA
jgi:asparagine synthase (glutamine-hydrolysing)